MKGIILSAVVALFVCLTTDCGAENVRYYSSERERISKAEFLRITEERNKKLLGDSKLNSENVQYYSPDGMQISKDEYKKLVRKRNSRIVKNQNTQNCFRDIQVYDEYGRLTSNPKYLDKNGRPIYDNKGRRFVYREDEAAMKANRRGPKSGDYIFFSTVGDMSRNVTTRFNKQKDGSLMPYDTYENGEVRLPYRLK